MSNKGGRVSPDYLADIAPEYAICSPIRIGKPICKTYETALEKSLKYNELNEENRRFTCVECRFFVSLYLEIEQKNVI